MFHSNGNKSLGFEGVMQKKNSFSVLLLRFFFHCTTIAIELKIIWGTPDSF